MSPRLIEAGDLKITTAPYLPCVLRPMADQEDRGFQVHDRRRFTEEGEVRKDSEPPLSAQEASTISPPSPEEAFPVTFSAFLMSLSTQALACLGEIAGEEEQVHEDVAAAREMIDILGMLRDKTRGNLDASESSLLDGILYDLRMRYVRKVRS